MSMPKGKHQGGQTQGYSQHYPRTTSFVSRSTTPQQRPDVGFHVAATPFPPQQGGGAAPPGGPQLRGLHHPHHGANPPIPPAHQQQPPPPPNQSQHSGGPPGPAPTSTPPGPADMGKQGPPHLQGQPQIPQGGQIQMSFGVPNQTRPSQSQPYFAGPRGPATRMPNHRPQVVNMSTNNVGQQIFPSHVPLQQMQMYPVPPINPNQMFVPANQMQMFTAGSRHQGAGTNYFPPGSQQQIMMHQHQLQYSGFQPTQTQFYFQGVRGAGMAGTPGGVGPGLTGGASQPVVVPGAPTQIGQTGQVSMMPIASSNVMGVPGLAGDSGTPSGPVSSSSSSGSKQPRRKHALDIVDPKTMKNVDIYESSGSSTPPRSGDSSARETPQPSSGSGQMDVAADFAARVAKAASEKSNGPPASQVPFSEPSSAGTPQQVINVNGPDHVSLNSVVPSSDSVLNQSDASVSKPQIIALDEQITSSWKQTQPKASSIGNKISSNSKGSKNETSLTKMEDQGSLNLETENLVKQDLERERSSIPLGVPSVSAKDVTVTQSDLPVTTSHMGQPVIPIGIVPVKDHPPSILAVDPSLTPVVSAITNSPDVELVHHRPSNREQYPGLKSSTPAHSSPRRKPRAQDNIPMEKVTSSQTLSSMSNIPSATATVAQVSSTGLILSSVDAKPQREHAPAPAPVTAEPKLPPSLPPAVKKTSPAPEQTALVTDEPVFITPAPKERREEKTSRGRDRSSQGKEAAAAEKAREKSQGRDREKQSAPRSRENTITTAPVSVSGTPPVSSIELSPPQRNAVKPSAVFLEEVGTKHQTNGETTDAVEGKASQQRNKHKRGQQKKELNRRGAEKEGTEMDAFAESSAPTIQANADSTPASASQPVNAAVPVVPPPATSVLTRPVSPVQSPAAPASLTSAPVAVINSATTTVAPQATTPVASAATAAASTSSVPVTTAATTAAAPAPAPSPTPAPTPAPAPAPAPAPTPAAAVVAAAAAAAASAAAAAAITTTTASATAPPLLTSSVTPPGTLLFSAPNSVTANSVLSSVKMADSIELKNEELDDMEKEEEEDKLVAARNEENSKVSTVNSEKPSLIEQSAPVKAANIPKYNYKDDQWSPNNQDGKKKYERDFLMSLKNEPLSKMKPNILPDLEIVLKDPRPARSLDITRPHDTFTPKFMSSQGPSSRGGVPPKRGSQQGKAKSGKPPGVIHVTLSLKEEVKLRETENAWKPGRLKPSEITEEEVKTEELYKKVRGVLNKLTPQKFNTLVEQVRTLPIDTKDKLQGVISLVFDKAIDEPGFSVAYALMCKVLSDMKVPADKEEAKREEGQGTDFVNFRKLIVTRCQQEFEKNNEAEINKEQRLKEISNTKDLEKRKELQVQFDEECRKLRMRSVGNIRFIGELFKLQMLTTNIMHRCIRQLLSDGDEESLECLCKLLTTIGRDLESKKQDLNPYFERMMQISHKRGEISSRVRFMLQDVIELRQHKWIPRRDDYNPKTIDQINKEAEKEAMEQALNSGLSSGPRYKSDDRGGDRGKKNRGPNEDGWSMAGRAKNYTVDTTRLKPKVVESDTLSLGCRSTYTNWNSNSKAADSSKKNASPVISNNSFAALSDMPSEEKRASGISSRSGSNKIAPSSSAEKERMLAGLKSATEDLRPQQSHLQQSRSSSRDNASRGGDVHSAPSSNVRLGPSSNEDVLRGASPDATVLPSDVPPMSDDLVKKKTVVLVDEYFNNSNKAETAQAVAETFGEANINAFVLECINEVLEKSLSARQNIGKLMCHLIKEAVVPRSAFFTSFSQVISDGDDLAIDIPRIWLYLAEILVPSLSTEVVTFSEFRNLAKRVEKLVEEVLQLLVKDKGPAWIRERWDAAGLCWTDFVPADKVDSFIKQHKLEFTVGVGGASPAPGVPLSMEEVQKKLVQFLKPEQGAAHSFDQICDWIGTNVGDRVSEPLFIRALMTALCESAVSQSANSAKLKEEVLIQHSKFFQKYIDNKEEYELQCLYAVQAFVNKLEHPQGLICSIFHLLWENNFISSESFTTWESSTEACAQVGKGVALKSLTTFFTALREGEDESEES